MRKLLATILLIGVMSFMAAPAMVGAQNQNQDQGQTIPSTCEIQHPDRVQEIMGTYETEGSSNRATGLPCLLDTMITVQNYMFWIILGVAVIMLLVGAFQFLTAGGSEDQTAQARQTLIYALVGVAVAYLARLALGLVMNLMS